MRRSSLRGSQEIAPPRALRAARVDAKSLELLLCGVPTIDVAAWRAATRTRVRRAANGGDAGGASGGGGAAAALGAFWAVVGDFSNERRARLLQVSSRISSCTVLLL